MMANIPQNELAELLEAWERFLDALIIYNETKTNHYPVDDTGRAVEAGIDLPTGTVLVR